MCVFPTLAYSETFEERVRIAKAAESADAYKPYQQVMYRGIGDHLAQTMRACFAKAEKPQTDAFVLVADVANDGKAQSIEVKPSTNISTCFADGVGNVSFPKPPTYLERKAFPIVIEMKITP